MRGVLKGFPMRFRSHNFPFSESFLSTIGNSQRPLVSKVGGSLRGFWPWLSEVGLRVI